MRDLEKEVEKKKEELKELERLLAIETVNFNRIKASLSRVVEEAGGGYALTNKSYLKEISAYELLTILAPNGIVFGHEADVNKLDAMARLKASCLAWTADPANAKKTIKVEGVRRSIGWLVNQIYEETDFGINILINFERVKQDAEVV